MRAINILNDPYEFYEVCKENEWTDSDYEDFDALSMFEGDPDIIRINGQTGYFIHVKETDTVYYYYEEYGEHIDRILIDFFEKRLHFDHCPENVQSWEWFENHNGIAYRGGYGYVYNIYPLRIAS